MVEKLEDSDGEEKGQQFTPTDWDWVMFLSGEINAIKTKTDIVLTVVIATLCAFAGFLIVFLITCSRISASNPDSIVNTIIGITAVPLFIVVVCILLYYIKYRREAEERVKLLEKCREDVFSRLDDPNKILECLFERCWKKGDKNK